jgi:group I intron endonuclease
MASPAEPSIGLIYLLTNVTNGKQYVGQTINSLHSRWRDHQNNAARGLRYPICLAIKKYGSHCFRVVELARAASLDELNALEVLYIAGLNTLRPHGYNLDSGGKNYRTHPETKAKIGAANKGRPSHRKGKKHSPESIEKMRAVHAGHPPTRKGATHTAEAKAKLSAARKGKPGHPHTEEFKARLRERNKGNAYALGYKQPPEHVGPRIANSTKTRRLNAALRS